MEIGMSVKSVVLSMVESSLMAPVRNTTLMVTSTMGVSTLINFTVREHTKVFAAMCIREHTIKIDDMVKVKRIELRIKDDIPVVTVWIMKTATQQSPLWILL